MPIKYIVFFIGLRFLLDSKIVFIFGYGEYVYALQLAAYVYGTSRDRGIAVAFVEIKELSFGIEIS